MKGQSKANKTELIYLLGLNYGERRRAYYERQREATKASEGQREDETTQWNQEILDEERAQQPQEPAQPKLIKGAINGRIQKWFIDGSEYKDPQVFLYDIESGVRKTIDGVNGLKKANTNMECVLEKMHPKTGAGETDTFGARSKTHTITIKLGDTYAEMKDKMLESLAKFQRNGSGWRLKEIIGLNINITKFNPLDGSGYSDLPACLKKNKAIINIQNKECEEECGRCKRCKESRMYFKWAIARALNPVDDNPQRLTKELIEQAKEFN